jgi:DNA (cytosine-5)-methyltransferase 1
MINEQVNMFDVLYPKYKITKPIRLIEFFAGYGSQALALKYLDVPFEHWKICEWAVKSIQAYKDIHFANENFDFSNTSNKEQLVNWLYNLGISSNYNEQMTKEQISRLSENQLRTIWNNIVVTHNLVNIQNVNGKDLCIKDIDKFTYLLTYSFPCQDLSLAGKGKGMSDTSTRSGMLWEVERILTECHELGNMPQILLMENVPQVHSEDNVEDFNKWKDRLEELGYKNYFQDLIATDYGIPQTRNRCFMISLLGDYSYTFPKPIPLKLKLKDMLEDNVDEKYYISDDLMNHILKTKEEHEEYTQYDRYNGDLEMWCRVWKDKSPTLNTKAKDTKIYVKNATKQGYLETTDGDGIYISSRMEHHRGTVQKNKIQTLTTSSGNDRGVVCNLVNKNIENAINKNLDKIKNNSFIETYNENIKNDGITSSLTTRCDLNGVIDNLRIRKLTPKECFRLMGVKDEDFDKVKVNQSDSSLYHLAGDSIVVNVLMAIFKELLNESEMK